MAIESADVIKLLLAVIIGGGIGLEREIHNKTAGFRTISLITIGSTLFTILSFKYGDTRTVANIVSGVGFLGAGAILRDESEGRVRGLTTAASIWVAAALGMAIGSGQYLLSIAVAFAVIVVLWLFTRLDTWIDIKANEVRSYDITCVDRGRQFEQIDSLFKECGLSVNRFKRFKRNGSIIGHWDTRGPLPNHNRLVAQLLADEDVQELRY